MQPLKQLGRWMRKRTATAIGHLPSRAFWMGTWPSIIVVMAAMAIGICLSIHASPWLALPEDPARVVAPLAQVQGAIAAISLAVLVLIVEAVQRREDIVDATYEVFIREALVRPVIASVLISTLGTVVAFILVRMPSLEDERNLALFAMISVSITILAILCFTLRALAVLRPDQYREFKRKAYLEQIRIGVTAQIEYINEIAANPTAPTMPSSATEMKAEQAMQQILGDVAVAIKLTRPDRIEEDIATIESAFRYAIEALASSDYNEILKDRSQALELPLFASVSRYFPSLWQASYASRVHENIISIYRLHRYIASPAQDGIVNDLRETVVANAKSSYQTRTGWPEGVAYGVGLAWGAVNDHVWLPIFFQEAHPLSQVNTALLRTVVESFQDSAASMVRGGDIAAFEQITAQISNLHDSLGRNRYGDGEIDYRINQPIDDLFHDVRLALAALAGLAIWSQESRYINNARAFVNRVHEILQKDRGGGEESFERLLVVDENTLAQHWWWWDGGNDGASLSRFRNADPLQYPVLYFLTASLIEGSDARLPQALGSIHLDGEGVLERHWAIMCDVAGIRGDKQETEKERIIGFIKAAKSADEHRRQDRIIATSISEVQVSQYAQEVLQIHKQTEDSSVVAITKVFDGADRTQILPAGDLDAPAETSFRLRGVFKGAFMRISGIHYEEHPSANEVVEAIEAMRCRMMINLIKDQADLTKAISTVGDELFTEISRVLADLQPQFPLFLTTGGGTDALWGRLHQAQLNIRWPISTALDRMPPDVEEVLRVGEVLMSQHIGEPALYIVDVARWGLLRRADVGDEPLRVEVHAISAERAGELLDTGRIDAGSLNRAEAIRALQLQVEVEVTQRVDFVVEDPSAAVRIPLQVPISSDEVMTQDRVGFDPFTTQEGRNDA